MIRRDFQVERVGAHSRSVELERVFEAGFRLLRFPPALEAQFEARQRQWRDRYLIIMCLLGVLVQNGYLLIEMRLVPDMFERALHLRLGWITCGCMAGVGLIALRPPVWLRESLVTAMALIIVGVMIYLAHASTAATAFYYPVGLVLIPMFVCIACRLRFWYALTLAVLTMGAPLVFILPKTEMQDLIGQTYGILLFAGTSFSVLACYGIEHQERRSFLLGQLDRLHRDQLTAANAKLHDLTTLDPLTGIYNRRQFEAALDTMWRQARESGRPLALLMIDVDAFKPYNDLNGHPEGDACLRQVAASLEGTGLREGAVVARIGGDEFAAIGPGLDLDRAVGLAGAMQAAVAALAIPHRHSAIAPVVSLSIGVASLRPQPWERPQDLMELADRAVYEAKAAGRNCVRAGKTAKPALSLVVGSTPGL